MTLHFVSEYDPTLTEETITPGIDLTAELIKHPNSTFLVRMTGDELITSHILNTDVLIVDKSCTPFNGQLIVAFYNLQPVVRYYFCTKNTISLSNRPDTQSAKPLQEDDVFQIFGVVTGVIRTFVS